MKFILVLQICSSIAQSCMPPIKADNILYDSWYDCGKAGYKSAYEILDKLTKVEVNKAKTMIQFRCVEVVAKDT
tara:strand:- start:1643 stop:1864 length:222 start_codon:yes stop_codon:yes gene_type:complete